MDFTVYNAKKALLKGYMEETLDLSQYFDLRSASGHLQANIERLEDERFNLVVVGEFSRGKSTFVNALLGERILPSSKNATTNIISKIVYAELPSFTLFFRDGKKQTISRKEFEQIKAANEEKPGKIALFQSFKNRLKYDDYGVDFNNIEYAEVGYPLSFCENQVDIVDTPGTNDLNVGRIDITYNYLLRAEAVVLVLSAEQPLTRSEKDFLIEQVVGNDIKDIFIVINFKDGVPGEEEKILSHVVDNLQDVQDFRQRTFIISSRQALLYRRRSAGGKLSSEQLEACPDSLEETGLPSFEAALGKYLSEEKGSSKLKLYVIRCDNALREVERYIRNHRKEIGRSADELRHKLLVEKRKFTETKLRAATVCKNLEEQLLAKSPVFSLLATGSAGDIKVAAQDAITEHRNVLYKMDGDQIKYVVERATTPLQNKFLKEIDQYYKNFVRDDVAKAAKRLCQLWQDMEFEPEDLPFTSELAFMDDFKIDMVKGGGATRVGTALGSMVVGLLTGVAGLLGGATLKGKALGIVAKLFPGTDGEQKIREQVQKHYEASLQGLPEKTCQRYEKNVKQICTAMNEEVRERVEIMQQQLISLIKQLEAKELDINTIQGELAVKERQMQDIRTKLQEVLK